MLLFARNICKPFVPFVIPMVPEGDPTPLHYSLFVITFQKSAKKAGASQRAELFICDEKFQPEAQRTPGPPKGRKTFWGEERQPDKRSRDLRQQIAASHKGSPRRGAANRGRQAASRLAGSTHRTCGAVPVSPLFAKKRAAGTFSSRSDPRVRPQLANTPQGPKGPCRVLVPLTGVEPVRCCHRGILSPLRLPIPP